MVPTIFMNHEVKNGLRDFSFDQLLLKSLVRQLKHTRRLGHDVRNLVPVPPEGEIGEHADLVHPDAPDTDEQDYEYYAPRNLNVPREKINENNATNVAQPIMIPI